MLRILVVEDDSQLAATLKYLVEDNPRYRVVATADDADAALAAVEEHDPDLVLLDLHLARGTTGFSVAARLTDLDFGLAIIKETRPAQPRNYFALKAHAESVGLVGVFKDLDTSLHGIGFEVNKASSIPTLR